MKTILLATVIGMIFFQSCTKENLVTPTIKTNELQVNGVESEKQLENPQKKISIHEESVEFKTIRCGTEIPVKDSKPKEIPGPPICLPKFPIEIK